MMLSPFPTEVVGQGSSEQADRRSNGRRTVWERLRERKKLNRHHNDLYKDTDIYHQERTLLGFGTVYQVNRMAVYMFSDIVLIAHGHVTRSYDRVCIILRYC